jgi:TetR/AcrR family transcriptional regulator, cholesterol catabolism regulator
MALEVDALTRNQAVRRSRVIDAAMELAHEGGYDAVQMRDVAARAQVALGTIYRYFSSKDHLLAACQIVLWEDLARRFAERPPRQATPGERVVDVLRRATRAAEIDPLRAAALVTATSSPDPAVRECQKQVMAYISQVLSDAMGDLDPAFKEQVVVCLRDVWFAALLGWVNDWDDVSVVGEKVESAARLVLRGVQ